MKITNEDNMELMARYPDKYFDLAIVDPPYGIGMKSFVIEKQQIRKKKRKISTNKQIRKKNKMKEWDDSIPNEEYFNEIKRVSKNQIIWGGNYFTDYLKPTKSWIFWYKGQQGLTMSDGELAWSSYEKVTRMINLHRHHIWNENPIHPTQKPVKLYEWLLMNYAKEGDKILDTHLGSGSIAIACHNLGYDLTACELDKEYYEAAMKRIKDHQAQIRMF